MDNHNSYRSYMLRIWHTPGDSTPIWHATLTAVADGTTHRFVGLAALSAFLHQLEAPPTIDPQPPSPAERSPDQPA